MSWDSLAPWYRGLEYAAFGHALERCRERFLTQAAEARDILVIGDGDGRFLARLAAAAPHARIDAIDGSRTMITLSHRRLGDETTRVRLTCSDIRRASLPPAAYDLVVTHFFLDCFDEESLPSVARAIAAAAKPNARWLLSEFQQRDKGPMRVIGGLLIAVMYLFFGVTTGLRARKIPQYAPLLASEGFRLEQRQYFWRGLFTAQLWRRDF